MCQVHNQIYSYRLRLQFLKEKLRKIEQSFPFASGRKFNEEMYKDYQEIKEKIIDIKDDALDNFLSNYSDMNKVYLAEYKKIKNILEQIKQYSFDEILKKMNWSTSNYSLSLKDYNYQNKLFEIRYEYEIIHQCINSISIDNVKSLQGLYLLQLQNLEEKLPLDVLNNYEYGYEEYHIELMNNILIMNNQKIKDTLYSKDSKYVNFLYIYIYLRNILYKLVRSTSFKKMNIKISSYFNFPYDRKDRDYIESKIKLDNPNLPKNILDELINLYVIEYCDEFLSYENGKFDCTDNHSLTKEDKLSNHKNSDLPLCLNVEFDLKNKENKEKVEVYLDCPYCSYQSIEVPSIDIHISTKHMEEWEEYINDKDVKRRILSLNLNRCEDCGLFVKKINDHLVKCSKRNNILFDEKKNETNCNLDEEKKIVEGSVLFNNANESKEKNTPKLKEQIPKHKAEIYQYDEALDIDIVTDEEKYQKDYTQQVQKDIKEFDESIQNEILQTIIIVRKNSNTKLAKKQRQKIRDYLYQYYKGHCQICAFTFRKEDEKNSFEMFNWNDKRVVKKKKSFISRADSLCLCRNCSANIKWGAFEPIFIDRIDGIGDFVKKSLDEIKEIICAKLEDNIVNKFKDDYEWNDIYVLEITVNDKPKNIYMTNRHLIELIAYLKLEDD